MKSSSSKRDTKREQINQALLKYLDTLSKQELVERLYKYAQWEDGIREHLTRECNYQPKAESIQELVSWTKKAIKEATKLGLDWSGEYQTVETHFKELIAQGQEKTVLKLGTDLFERGLLQMDSSEEQLMDDKLVECMKVVFSALKQTSMSAYNQMLWVWELEHKDRWQLCTPSAAAFWEQQFPTEVWSKFANHLKSLLGPFPKKKKGSFFPSDHHRNKVVEKIILSLEKAHRNEDVLELLIQEAEWTGDFLPVVDLLISKGNTKEAEAWIRRGIENAITNKRISGTSSLRHKLLKLRETEQDWEGVAALESEEFFLNPASSRYETLKEASQRIGCWDAVRANVLYWLASPKTPEIIPGQSIGEELPPWPLPATGNNIGYSSNLSSNYDVLIGIAIEERQPEEVLRWYDAKLTSRHLSGTNLNPQFLNRIAEAVVNTHLNRAIEIWLQIAESFSSVSRGRYRSAVDYLAKIRRILEDADRQSEWEEVLSQFNQTHSSQSKLKRLIKEMAQRPLTPQ